MDYKEKYEQALAKAKEQYNYPCMRSCMGILEEIFPELKESEDKKIMKEIAEFIYNTAFKPKDIKKKEKWLAWLEKQGESEKSILEDAILDGNEDGLIAETIRYRDEKRGKKKSANKPKPKFKVNDWIIDNNIKTPFLITDISNGKYDVISIYGDDMAFSYDEIERFYRLWTIQDAKDGDVLVNGSNIFMFHFINDTRLMGYCHVNTDNGRFYDDIGKNECFCLIDAVVNPATKEQRDLLFQKMNEAGYTFDFENKKLKKIEQKVEENNGNIVGISSNPEWSEEDEQHIDSLLKRLDALCRNKFERTRFAISEDKEWLKSLKERIGGKV